MLLRNTAEKNNGHLQKYDHPQTTTYKPED